MNLIIITDADRLEEHSFRLTDHRAEHIRAILKAGVGDTVEVGRLNGPQGKARLERVTADEVILRCNDWSDVPLTGLQIDLICALPRPQTFKKVLITGAMMGVRSLHFIRANRVEKSYFQSPLVQPEQQLPYLIEGLAQGKLTRLPLVTVHDRFRKFFEDDLPSFSTASAHAPLRLLCDSETDASLDRVYDRAAPEVIVAVGPEGGWVPFELELMHERGFASFTLGPRILRVEHAVTATLAQIELLRMMAGR